MGPSMAALCVTQSRYHLPKPSFWFFRDRLRSRITCLQINRHEASCVNLAQIDSLTQDRFSLTSIGNSKAATPSRLVETWQITQRLLGAVLPQLHLYELLGIHATQVQVAAQLVTSLGIDLDFRVR